MTTDVRRSRYRRRSHCAKRARDRSLCLESLEQRIVLDAVISEILTSNIDGLRDEDGDTSDWIELYNPTAVPVDLTNWALTDELTDKNKWQLPAVSLQPEQFLIVFASGKDRDIAGQQLHTSFNLDSDGEHVGLYRPDGSLASSLGSIYPQQTANVSYGHEFRNEVLVAGGDQASYFVPTDDSLGSSWQQPGFDDSTWSSGPTGIGFGVAQPGFEVTYFKAQPFDDFNGNITTINEAFDVINTPAYQSAVVSATADVVNHMGTGGGGHYGADLPFPTQTIGVDINDFVLEANTTIEIPSAGQYSFGVNSDDGFRLTITGGGDQFSAEFPNTRGASDTITTFDLPDSGSYELNLVMFERGGGSSVELFAAAGAHSTFDAGVFDLVGDVAAGGLAAAVQYISGASSSVATDIEPQMLGVNSSAFVRMPFTVTDVAALDTLRLSILYDDGFVATINGTEIARRNAPASTPYDATANSPRDPSDVLQVEQIVLPPSALIEGDNVLTLHGLNSASSDPSFLVLPELTASGLVGSTPSYFATPTPGSANLDPVEGVVAQVTADFPAGFYQSSFSVALSSTTSGATIRYTLDGSTPSETNGSIYSGPITISGTSNLRAVATKANHATLPLQTWSYLFLDDVLTQANEGLPPTGWPTTWKSNVVDYGIDPDVVALEGAQAVKDALLAIPTWSITTDLDNLFDDAIGIYSNANQDGQDWERPASVELIQPDGSPGFMVNAGLRIRGGFSRSNNNPKHSFRLFFRGSYGDGSLEYPVHGETGTDEFKKIDLRTAQNYSWSFQGDASNNFVADVLNRYNQRDLGQPYTRSSWLHLYLNGQYWGLYQTQERAEAEYGETYFGGNDSEYDVLKPERGPYTNIATDGNFAAYDRLYQQALARAPDGITPAFEDHALFMQAQGLNPDGTTNPAYETLLDVDNLIAYMIIILHGGNLDAPISNFLGNNRINNYFAVRNRNGDEGFRFFIHDSEHTLRDVNRDRNGPYEHPNYESGVGYFNPQWLHQQLMANKEYRLQFADQIQAAFFHDGPMTADALIAKLDAEAALIDAAIIGESARWGDAKQETPLTRSHWISAIAGLRNNHLPNRNAILIDQFRNTQLLLKDAEGNYTIGVPAPLFPAVDAPEILIDGKFQSGGQIPAGAGLRMTSDEGVIYYTTDGSDPRLTGGSINPAAITFDPTTVDTTLLATGSNWKFYDSGVDLGTAWRDPAFDDSLWSSGDAQLGYGDGDETTVVGFGPDPANKYRTTYFRTTFNASSEDFSSLKLRIRRDDGAVIYLNGTEIARSNMPAGSISFDSFAASVASNDGNTWYEFLIDPSLVDSGNNTLAVEVHQANPGSSDISFDAELIASSQTQPPITISDSLPVRARVLSGNTWSALHAADFVVPQEPASTANLRITEFSYNPAGNGDAEFIELQNITAGTGGVKIDLGSLQLTDGPSSPFIFPVTATLDPQQYALIVADIDAFTATYPSVDPALILGQYAGKLSNGGERIRLLDAVGDELIDFDYNDGEPWPTWADGVGGSVVLSNPANTPADQLNKYYHWRGSTLPGGSPGTADPLPAGVVINEILAHTDAPDLDTIELHNTTGADIEIGGWFLSDSSSDLLKYRIPGGTILPAGGYLTFDEDHFNPTPLTPGPNDFALSGSHGDAVWLVVGDASGTSVEQFVDQVDFGATFNGVTLGRVPNGAGRMWPLQQPSLGAANGTFAVSEVIVNEVNYHPADPSPAALALDPNISASDLEFVELYNHSPAAVDLTNWRLRGDADYDFLPGQSIASAARLVIVNFDPVSPLFAERLAAFRAHYGIDTTVDLLGPMLPSLSNNYGFVKLQKPDMAPVDEPTVIPRVLVDEVSYDDLAPWPETADGSGDSLQRSRVATHGNSGSSWRGAAPTPGGLRFVPQITSFLINSGQSTRSAVTSITVEFDMPVTTPPSAFTLHNVTTDQSVTGLSVQSTLVDGRTISILSFEPGTSVVERVEGANTLADGDYQLTVSAGGITAQVGGAALDEDVLLGQLATDLLFRKYGDHDGNDVVDLVDFAEFRGSYASMSADPQFEDALDADGNGIINLLDFAIFRANYGS